VFVFFKILGVFLVVRWGQCSARRPPRRVCARYPTPPRMHQVGSVFCHYLPLPPLLLLGVAVLLVLRFLVGLVVVVVVVPQGARLVSEVSFPLVPLPRASSRTRRACPSWTPLSPLL